MKATQYNKYGGPEVLEINKNAPSPTVESGKILVEIHAASLNPFDVTLRSGRLKEMMPLQFPVTIGGDFSGVVFQLGKGILDFKIGDEVYGQSLIVNGGSGALAEFCAAKTVGISHKPKNINHVEAASLPLVGASAIQVLVEHIKLKKDQKILIHGGSGGIGSIAIQLAKYLGAYIVTTVSAENGEFAKGLGADEVIDYKTQKFEDLLKDFDAVFDTVGGDTMGRSFKVLKKGGVIVSMLGVPNPELAKEHGVTSIGQVTRINNKTLARLTELVEKGAINPQIDKVFPLDEAREAFEYFESAHPRGKVVIKIKGI
ncbi:MAG: hypothetical protein A3D74_05475 [Candidatus Levybacteria bacterium RIFCSPHIGHO2_02_FULL_37_13]|nr:MAG: hypothetical protein A3D74_05475 [Candidatus Levybacteria bacterium RIFCSPHIGHO2_02_FULL_37_13]OGH29262.1 MAG: hypothetical protein A3E40_03365 [Candidatus Levybacteria bacterium RIFCSPHIGHO2_12_FULL_37_9]OGH40394.1 MAG: hypothetical protein A3B41_02700 [Candidatus Levybacteria bacterium RIFCSPLOWO2_01_FULL_37_26]